MGNIFFRDSALNDTYGGRDLLKLGKTAQSVATQVRNNDFSDLYIGDYFTTTMNNRPIKWHIAHFNYFRNMGDTAFDKPHLVLMNNNSILETGMNPTNTTEGGYVNSDMRKNKFTTILNYLKNTVLGDYILTHRELLSVSMNPDASSGGCPSWKGCASGYGWYNSTIEMLSEPQVYGATVFSSSGYDIGIGNTQFAIFKLDRQFLNIGIQWWWLRAIANSTNFCDVYCVGRSTPGGASRAGGVRIYFCFG